MKKYIAIFALAASLVSCQDFLKEKVVSTLTQDYYNSPEGIEALVKGCYQILRFKPDYSQGQYLCGSSTDIEVFAWTNDDRIAMGTYSVDAWSPESKGTRMTPNISSLIGASSDGVSEGVYPEVNRCNIILENVARFSQADQTKLVPRVGESLFLRAYSYYLMSNQVGACPLILKSFSEMPANFAFPKAPLSQIYERMIGDLRSAVEKLPATTSELGRVTKPAAAHLLSKMYLNRAQAAGWENSADPYLKALYKGNVATDLDSCIYYATSVIDQMKGNSAFGGLEPDFASLWKNAVNNYDRDKSKEIILSAQYDPTGYNGRYGNTFVHLYNSNHTSLNAATPRTMEYGRPYGTLGGSDWAYDSYDKLNDSRYYKSFLVDYAATDANAINVAKTKSKKWDKGTSWYYNQYLSVLSPMGGSRTAVDKQGKILYNERSIVFVENSKDEPYDSLWVASQPFIMMVRWMVGSPGGADYFDKDASGNITGLKAGITGGQAVVPIAQKGTRKLMYRVSGDQGDPFGLDRSQAVANWYVGTKKWLDINRGNGTQPNGTGAIDIVLYRLAETYLTRAEAYGRKSDFANAIADINVVRKRAAYRANEVRPDALAKYDAGVLSGRMTVNQAVATDNDMLVDATYWDGASAKSVAENYVPTAATDMDRFIHFIYNEKGREFIWELNQWEDLHNAGILYDRVYYRDMMGAPSSSTGTTNFPFPEDELAKSGSVGAQGVGKGQLDKKHTFKAWPQSYLELLTDEQGKPLDEATKDAYQNPGY